VTNPPLYSITITREVKFTPSELAEILVTALEGGYSWFDDRKSSIQRMKNEEGVDARFTELGIEDYYRDMAPAVGGSIYFRVHDHDKVGEATPFELDAAKLLEGIRIFLTGNDKYSKEPYYSGNLEELMYEIDLNAADLIVQLALFGEAVYG
jgi:hypothetical protein